MFEAHSGLGELLVVVYLGVAIGSVVTANRGGLPAWLTGAAHALLGVQILLGIYLLIQNPNSVSWTHPLFGFLALAGLGLVAPLRRRLGRPRGIAISAIVVAVFAAIAVIIAMTR